MDIFSLVLLSTLLVTYFTIGIFASRNVTTNTDYFLAGQSLSIPAITATLLATQIGGGMFLGTAQNPFHGLLYIIGMVFGFLFLGMGFASKLQEFKVTTVGEIFEKAYNSQILHKLTALLSVLSMCGIIIAQIVATKSVLIHFAGIENDFIFLAFWALILLYTIIGGLSAVVMTDMVQVIVILTVFTGICLYSLTTSTVPFFTMNTFTKMQTLFTQSSLTYGQAFKIMSMPMLFSLIEQDLAQRFFSAQSKKAAALAALCASILLLLFSFVPFYFGIQAQLLNIAIPKGTSPLLPLLRSITNPLFFTLALSAILSAITSTTDSLLCAVSAIITTAITSFNKTIKPSLWLSRSVTLSCGVATLIISYFVSNNIINILVDSYEISVAMLFIPLILCFVLKDLRESAALTSSACGGIGFIFFRIFNETSLHDYSMVAILAFSLFGYFIGHILTKK